MICMKDLQPYNEHHDPVNVSYLAIGGNTIICLYAMPSYMSVCYMPVSS